MEPRICYDSAHDDRWCPTCEAMWDGVRLTLQVVTDKFGEHYASAVRGTLRKEQTLITDRSVPGNTTTAQEDS